MKTDKGNREELNYKQAYHYLFNKVTDLVESLKVIQEKAEDICVGEKPFDNSEIDTNDILEKIRE